MGANESKKIQDQIQQKYKSIRKFYSEFYGEITLVKKKDNNQIYVKIEKIVHNNNKQIKQYLEKRIQKTQSMLINLHEFLVFKIDLCSGAENYVLIFEYNNHTLQNEIQARQKQEKLFQIDQVLKIFYSLILLIISGEKIRSNKILANKDILYKSQVQLQTIQAFLCNHQQDSINYTQKQRCTYQNKKIYVAPQIFQLICRKQFFHAKQLNNKQSCLVFTLGMNFLEILTLADLSGVYQNEQFNERYLKQINLEVKKLYGDQIEKLTGKMTNFSASQRPKIEDVKNYLRILMKGAKIDSESFQLFNQYSHLQ